MVGIGERSSLLAAAHNGALDNTVVGLGILARRIVRRGESILVCRLLGHGVLSAIGQVGNHDILTALKGNLTVVRNGTGAHRRLARSVNGVIVFVGEVGLSAVLSHSVQMHRELEVVLIGLGVIRSVAPVDILVDSQVARSVNGKLAVVAQLLGHTCPIPRRSQDRRGSACGVVCLVGHKRRRTIRTWSICRNVSVVALVGNIPVVAAASNGAVGGNLFCFVAITRQPPIAVLVIELAVVTDVVARSWLRAVLVDEELRVDGIVIELVSVARCEGSLSRTLGSPLHKAVGVEVNGRAVSRGLRKNRIMICILRIIQSIDDPILNADAIEQTNREGVIHGHRAIVGVNVIVTHRDERRGNLHGNDVTRRKVVALGDRYFDFRKICTLGVGGVHAIALVDNAGERPSIATVTGRALMESVSERKIHLVVVRTHTRDFHEGTKGVGKGQVARGTRGALHLFNRRA